MNNSKRYVSGGTKQTPKDTVTAGAGLALGPCGHCYATMYAPVAIIHVPGGKNEIVHPKCRDKILQDVPSPSWGGDAKSPYKRQGD